MHWTVFGAGSLGSLIGGLLARHTGHTVTLVGRPAHVERITATGLRLTGAVETTVHPQARTDPVDADCAVVTVKSYDTASAAAALAAHDYETVLSLQNGLGNEATLGDRLTAPVLAGTTTYGARRHGPGVVECTGIGSVTLGPYGMAGTAVAERVGAGFRAADIETTVTGAVERTLWRKLAINAAINPVTALARLPNGAVVDGPARPIAAAAAREAARAGDLDPAATVARVREVAAATAHNHSSMRADVEAGRRTEIDAINGVVVDRLGSDEASTNAMLTALVRAWERERDLRPADGREREGTTNTNTGRNGDEDGNDNRDGGA